MFNAMQRAPKKTTGPAANAMFNAMQRTVKPAAKGKKR
jgi:hypothetical protein